MFNEFKHYVRMLHIARDELLPLLSEDEIIKGMVYKCHEIQQYISKANRTMDQ